LKNYFADQSAIGLEYFPTVDTRITLESFIKEYADMITYEILDGSDGRDSLNHQNVINGGKGRSQGLELFIQKKYSMKWYGSLAWSHSIAEGVDPRTDYYYTEIDKRMRENLPHKFQQDSSPEEPAAQQPVQTVASANRNRGTGRNVVKLSSSEAAIAKRLGLSNEQYASEKLKLQRR